MGSRGNDLIDDVSKIQNLRIVSYLPTYELKWNNLEHEFELKWDYYSGTEGVNA